ncbi:MAG: ABC transporter ATP-binding protein [Actinobacteria bacterium]|nr:MAG: ABC transporter ATP-binding protein [Actinomycetota bacterium]
MAAVSNGLAVEITGLEKSFGRRKVLEDIDLAVPSGRFLSIFGPNGAGKTTLVRIMATLLAPTKGSVVVAGVPLADDPAEIRKRVGLISHSPLLYPELTAEENLRFYGGLYAVDRLGERIDRLLESVELDHRRYDIVRTFSKGMYQRLAIARALLHEPEILFLDEPYSGLDPHASEILDGLLAAIRENHTFVMITHSLEKGLEMADAAIVLSQGRIVHTMEEKGASLDEFREAYRAAVKGEEC